MLSSLLLLNALQNPHSKRSGGSSNELTNLLLLSQLLNQTAGDGGKRTPPNPERSRLRALAVRDFCKKHYLPERNHDAKGPTAELATSLVDRLEESAGRDLLVKELAILELRRFRAWLAKRVAAGTLRPATANRHLRQLRAIWNHAARWQWAESGRKWRAIKRPPPMEFFPEQEPDVDAWTPEEEASIERQARLQKGLVGGVPADVFWTAWALVMGKIGCRITAMMSAKRSDYDPLHKALLLRRENQKQKKDQRIALPPRAAAAVERLLAAHEHERIFGCWPFDPPVKATGRPKWKVLAKHFEQRLVIPAGLSLAKGVKTRQFRRSAATICEENGGNAQELLGHSSRATTERYKDRKRRPICRQSLCIPDGGQPQRTLF